MLDGGGEVVEVPVPVVVLRKLSLLTRGATSPSLELQRASEGS